MEPSIAVKDSVHLPDELVLKIISYIPEDDQSTFHSLSILSRQWNKCVLPILYKKPRIRGKQFTQFAATICSQIKGTRSGKNALGNWVHELDLSEIVYEASPSLLAKIINRTRLNLETFTAPAAVFGVNCFVALAHCHSLRELDLSLVHRMVSLHDLTRSWRNLSNLNVLRFPRSDYSEDPGFNPDHIRWPPELEVLDLRGGLQDHFFNCLGRSPELLPQKLRRLEIHNCTAATVAGVSALLQAIGVQLQTLAVRNLWSDDLVASNPPDTLDEVLIWCPNLLELSIESATVSGLFPYHNPETPPHPLLSLRITNSSDTQGRRFADPNLLLYPDSIVDALQDRYLRHLAVVTVDRLEGWWDEEGIDEEVAGLVDMLEQISELNKLRKEGLWSDPPPPIRIGITGFCISEPP